MAMRLPQLLLIILIGMLFVLTPLVWINEDDYRQSADHPDYPPTTMLQVADRTNDPPALWMCGRCGPRSPS